MVLGADRVTLDDGEIRTYSFYDTIQLFDWALDNFSYQSVLDSDEVIGEVPVTLSKIDHVTVHPAEEVEVLLPNDIHAEDLERNVVLEEPVEAPVQEGDVLGTLELRYNDTVYATVDLLAMHDVEASQLLTFWHNVQLFFQKTAVRVTAVILLVLLAAVRVWKLLLGRRRYRYGRSVGRGRSGGYRGRRRH